MDFIQRPFQATRGCPEQMGVVYSDNLTPLSMESPWIRKPPPRIKKLLYAFLILLSLSCSKDEDPLATCDPADRIGAKCNDGTSSTATGSGACSGHGG